MDDLKQNFDPSNIGRALGRKATGMFLNLFKGKDKEGSVKGKRARAKEAKDGKKNNPFYTKVSEGSDKPVKKNDSFSDVLSKIHNLLKLNIRQNEKEHQLEKNFSKEKEDEREKRHLELVKAISGLTGGGTVTQVGGKEKGNFFGDLLNRVKDMIENFKKLLGPLLDFTKMIGQAGFKALTSFLSLLGTPGVLAFLFPAAIVVALKLLGDKQAEDIKNNPDDPRWKDSPYARVVRKEFESKKEAADFNIRRNATVINRRGIEGLVNSKATDAALMTQTGATRDKLKEWLKDHPETTARWQGPVRDDSGQIVMEAANYEDAKIIKPDRSGGLTTATARTAGSAPGASSSISPNYFKEPPKLQETATPTPTAPSGSTKRVQAAIAEQFYQDEVEAAKQSVIINSPKTVVGGDTKVQSLNVEESAPVRIDDPTLKHIQERNLRRF